MRRKTRPYLQVPGMGRETAGCGVRGAGCGVRGAGEGPVGPVAAGPWLSRAPPTVTWWATNL
ncbi:hypothetical protein GCM10023082_15480 [Streptomyces tremellae]|uniref:Uncharacterized protein n=1 Tax=Streptomyces tremellae TaxID=1124239 RepID=A0ABP7EGI5_9ACTN